MVANGNKENFSRKKKSIFQQNNISILKELWENELKASSKKVVKIFFLFLHTIPLEFDDFKG